MLTKATGGGQQRDHPVSRLEVLDLRPNFYHLPRYLMAQDQISLDPAAQGTLHHQKVMMAEAAGPHPHNDLSGVWLRVWEGDNGKALKVARAW
jgi:hypothetical protein